MAFLASYELAFLIAAVVIISLSLLFYSIGVWAEQFQGRLKGWHLAAFGLGLMCDLVGSAFIGELMRSMGQDTRIHAVLGCIAIFLMTIHGIWAVWTYWKNSEKANLFYKRHSMTVWYIWLTNYCVAVYIGMVTNV